MVGRLRYVQGKFAAAAAAAVTLRTNYFRSLLSSIRYLFSVV